MFRLQKHHQVKTQQSLGTLNLCTLWDLISFRIIGILKIICYYLPIIINDMGSNRVHTFIVPRLCLTLA
jgi:hypothetical protein